MKIAITPTSLKPGNPTLEPLKAFGAELVFNPYNRPMEEGELISLASDCQGILAGLDQITAKVIENCPKLKVISRYGVGYDRVDVKAASARNVAVSNTPGANSEAVGELAFSLILALARCLTYLDQKTKNNEWVRIDGIELKGKIIGIIGFGAIGKIVARCAAGFGMHIMAYDPYMDEIYCQAHGIENCSLEEVIRKADVISLHLPLTDDTYHMINAKTIAQMKDQVILVNTSRGGIIDEVAACEGLRSGKIGGLGLDAYEKEPPTDSTLFVYDNVLATPHTGAHTIEAKRNMADMAVQNLLDILKENACNYIVNPIS